MAQTETKKIKTNLPYDPNKPVNVMENTSNFIPINPLIQNPVSPTSNFDKPQVLPQQFPTIIQPQQQPVQQQPITTPPRQGNQVKFEDNGTVTFNGVNMSRKDYQNVLNEQTGEFVRPDKQTPINDSSQTGINSIFNGKFQQDQQAQMQAQQQAQLQQQVGQINPLTPNATTPIDGGELVGAGLQKGVIGGITGAGAVAGGALALAGAGATVGSAVPIAGTLIGAGIGLVAGIAVGVFNNIKKQKTDTISAQNTVLTNGKTNLAKLIALAKAEPRIDKKQEYVDQFNTQIYLIKKAQSQMIKDTNADLFKFDDAKVDLQKFENFYAPGGGYDTYTQRMQQVLFDNTVDITDLTAFLNEEGANG
jgi:hypothetical protein